MAGGFVRARFERDLSVAAARAAQGGKVLATRCGPIEIEQAGEGTPLLMVHGSGGGHDQGMAWARPLVQQGVRVIAMSRFGYLRTPRPADASPEAQADAHVCVLDALGITRAAVMGVSTDPTRHTGRLRRQLDAAARRCVPGWFASALTGRPTASTEGVAVMVWIKWAALALVTMTAFVALLAAYGAWHWAAGILHPAVLGLFTLIDMRGGEELARGELMRFFAEAAWYPTALLPSQGVRWVPVDDASARATLVDGGLSLTMTFSFQPDGTMRSARADARGRTSGDKIVMTPWEGRCSDVQERDGMRVPMSGEVAWLTPQGRKPYWRGTIASLSYEYAPSTRVPVGQGRVDR